ncbi:uncharacterized protein SAPINGB_P002389 [Magnusiomyces paraingens]|uniref:FHA domain-containing protein n=1 Tax=Magnusiomyces paraingens TaxID=2606893 RepID=A0A5E8BDX7_9ASCO|nr:uncharacterized protein SAPINGB_P002389 [Saprochaete ingens]VVT49679.1 unnamed protein product [Saprochaete ingens]
MGRHEHRDHRDDRRDNRKDYRDDRYSSERRDYRDDHRDDRRDNRRSSRREDHKDRDYRDNHRSRSPRQSPEHSPERPNYHRSGLLALERNRVTVPALDKPRRGNSAAVETVVLKYHEPADRAASPPVPGYALVLFPKSGDPSQTIRLNKQTAFLVGTDSRVADIVLDAGPPVAEGKRPRADAQHAVIQFRVKRRRNKQNQTITETVPYIIDLESARGTYLNGEEVPAASYVELRAQDVLEFGALRDEYVFMFNDEKKL